MSIFYLPCTLAYVRNGHLELLPYFETNRFQEVWGIQYGTLIYKLTHETVDEHDLAEDLARRTIVDGVPALVPHSYHLQSLYAQRHELAGVLDMLRRYGVQAEDWQGYYLTFNPHVLFSFGDGDVSVMSVRRPGRVRLALPVSHWLQ